ncbi:MAG: aspartyl protease family protein [Proteobacteria bacterium]|nr:aspartyl protease family protein [Pseudomonadota bacterium]
MTERPIDRRGLLVFGAATLASPPALARPRGTGRAPDVQINLAGQPAPPPAGPDGQPALIRAGADAVSRMTTQVRLDSRGPFEFVVDTGANRSVVSIEAARSLGLPAGPPTPVHGIAGVEPADTVEVSTLSVGDVRSADLILPALPETHLGAQGLLGVDIMKDRRVVLDFVANTLLIGPPRHDADTSGSREQPTRILGERRGVIRVPARYRFGQLTIVDADVAGVAVTAFLDSGSQNTVANLALRNALVGRRPLLAAQMRQVELLSATGQVASGELCVLPGVRLGGLGIDNLGAVFADLHTFDIWRLVDRPAILIGIDVLRHFDSVELDFSRRQVVFRAPKSATTLFGN